MFEYCLVFSGTKCCTRRRGDRNKKSRSPRSIGRKRVESVLLIVTRRSIETRWLIIECRSIGRPVHVDVCRLKRQASSEWKINRVNEEGGMNLRVLPRGWNHCPKEQNIDGRIKSMGNHRCPSTSFVVNSEVRLPRRVTSKHSCWSLKSTDRSIDHPTFLVIVLFHLPNFTTREESFVREASRFYLFFKHENICEIYSIYRSNVKFTKNTNLTSQLLL